MSEDYNGLNLVELLNLLEPVPEPPPVSMWPQTAGWIWLGLFLLIAIGLVTRHSLRIWRAKAYRREALAEIQRNAADPAALAGIVRRTALAAYPRDRVAGRYGQEWLAFLGKTYGGSGFQSPIGQAFAAAPYTKAENEQSKQECAALAKQWVKRHRSAEAGRP